MKKKKKGRNGEKGTKERAMRVDRWIVIGWVPTISKRKARKVD